MAIVHHQTVKCERISQELFAHCEERDFEGVNCDECGAPMHVGERRWMLRTWFTYTGQRLRHCETEWFICSEVCLQAASEAAG